MEDEEEDLPTSDEYEQSALDAIDEKKFQLAGVYATLALAAGIREAAAVLAGDVDETGDEDGEEAEEEVSDETDE